MDSLEEMNKFLETYNLPIPNQEEIENLNRPITSKETNQQLKVSQQRKPGPGGFTGVFYQTFKEELMPILLKLFQKIEEKGMLLNSFYKASITLIPKPDKDTIRIRKLQTYFFLFFFFFTTDIFLTNIDAKIFNKMLAN